jgi:hypothetical protein
VTNNFAGTHGGKEKPLQTSMHTVHCFICCCTDASG